MRTREQAIALNTHARMHEQSGNTLLASWMRESAKHFESLDRATQRALDSLSLGNYEVVSTSRRIQNANDWYAYEEEYVYNFFGE